LRKSLGFIDGSNRLKLKNSTMPFRVPLPLVI
jgi:hypothetical protein